MFRLFFRESRPYPLTAEEVWLDNYLRIKTACQINLVLLILVHLFARFMGYSGLFGEKPQPGNFIGLFSLLVIVICAVLNLYHYRRRILSPATHLNVLGTWLYLGNLVVVTALIHFAGGVHSLFSFLYLILAMVGSFMLSTYLVAILAFVGIIFHGAILWLGYHGIIDSFPAGLFILSPNLPKREATTLVFLVSAAMTVLSLVFGKVIANIFDLQRRQLAMHRANLEVQVDQRTRDLTEALQELKDANRLLDREKTRQERFFAHVTHQFRTPIHIINNFVSNFFSGVYGEISPPQKEALQHLSFCSRNLLNLINNLLDISKTDSGRMALQMERHLLHSNLQNIIEVMKPLAKTRGIDIFLEMGETVPETIYTDRVKLESILTNLLHNAVKFSKKSPVYLRVNRSENGEGLVFQVEDFGKGVKPENKDRIFESFVQVDSPEDFRGSGLGLHIARILSKMLDGVVRIADKSTPGAMFEFSLPLTGPDEFEKQRG